MSAGIQRAYDLLSRCHALTNDPAIEDRMEILGGRLGDYYLARAKHYLDRPDGTGANVGWAYLEEALAYNRADAGAIRDEMTRRQSGSSASLQAIVPRHIP